MVEALARPDQDQSGLDLAALGRRVRDERLRQRLSLDGLAGRAGVSRSMLSAVENGEKAPTVVVLHRIATGLGSSMSRLLGEERSERVIVLRRGEQVVARDPTGWERRNLAPVLPGVEFELMRTTIPPGLDAGTFPSHGPGSREYVAVEAGELRLTVGGAPYCLRAGDAISYEADVEHAFANPGEGPCVYYLAVHAPRERVAAGDEREGS
jgi:XRE family transcriptional regulator, regulator of sulfur utilization